MRIRLTDTGIPGFTAIWILTQLFTAWIDVTRNEREVTLDPSVTDPRADHLSKDSRFS